VNAHRGGALVQACFSVFCGVVLGASAGLLIVFELGGWPW